MYYYIYKITNINTKKIYIGSHQTTNLNDGYFGSGIYLKRAIAKHGIDYFQKEILEFCNTKEDMHKKETELLQQLVNIDAYNLKYCALGGNTRAKYTADEKAAYIRKLVNNPDSPIGKRNSDAFNYGKQLSPETKQKIKDSRQKFLQNATLEQLKKWKDNVVAHAKRRCASMTLLISKPVEVVCKTTDTKQLFKSKAECAAYFNVSTATLTNYMTCNYKKETPKIKLLTPFVISYAAKIAEINK